MNKLQVAVKLLQLLNERTYIDSKIVADALDVSVRTAQRYLVDLSFMPCVINAENSHRYALNPDYKIKDVILNGANNADAGVRKFAGKEMDSIGSSLCLACGEARNYFSNRSIFDASKSITSRKYEMDKLAQMIKTRLAAKKCSFP